MKPFKQLRADHLGHFKAGTAIAFAVAVCTVPFLTEWLAILAIALSSILVGWGKEIFDSFSARRNPEYSDALITQAPALFVIFLVIIVNHSGEIAVFVSEFGAG